ncbi:MAG: DNA polymerase III subunit delta [Candidatus Pelagibacter sp.]|tara:strand:+ start:1789 stop:2772 length:984 start_codon:yes stop_codon:yes gene_type:complete
MIIKSFEINKLTNLKKKFFLFYGENEGFKNEIIKKKFEIKFEKEIYRYEEKEILDNDNIFFEKILNKSFFEEKKLIIISRASDKIIKIIAEIFEKKVDDVTLILSARTLEKKSKLRNFFEKSNDLVCVPFYEDNNQTLSKILYEFLNAKKISFSQENSNLLISRCRGDRENLYNELNKIDIFLSGKSKISIDEILKITNLAHNYSINDLVDSCLSKNIKKTSHIINENIFSNEDCIFIIRTMLNKSKRLLRIFDELKMNKNLENIVNQFKPPIFWKEKDIVINQINKRDMYNIRSLIDEINEVEVLIKENFDNCLKIIKDFLISKAK